MFSPKRSRWPPHFFTFLTSLTHHPSMKKFSEKQSMLENFRAKGRWRENFLTLIVFLKSSPFIERWWVSDVRNGKKNGESRTSFWREHARKNYLIWVNRALLAKKATVATSPKILQSELWREMFSAKYDLSGPISEFSQLMRFVKEQVRI